LQQFISIHSRVCLVIVTELAAQVDLQNVVPGSSDSAGFSHWHCAQCKFIYLLT